MNMWHLRYGRFQLPLLVAALIVSSIQQAAAVNLTDGPQVEKSATTATIHWTTDVTAGTRLSFGTTPDALTQKAEGPVTSTHTITLEGLQPATTYYYSVGSARVKLGTGSFTTNGAGGTKTKAPSPTEARIVRPTAGPAKAPPTGSTWASLDSLPDHFDRHGPDFNAKSADDYAAQAWAFLQRARQEKLPMKWDDSDSTLRVWDPAKKIFAAYTRGGKTRTFFKPGNPGYWSKQPGRSISPTDLPF